MIRTDARCDVALREFAAQSWRVAVHGFTEAMGVRDLLHHFRIAVEDAGEIHHLAQVAHFIAFEQAAHRVCINAGTGCFEDSGGHATRCAEEEMERHLPSIVDHELHTFNAHHIGDLVRIAHGGHGTMQHGEPREFTRHQHAAFNVYVRINEAGHDVPVHGAADLRDRSDATVLDHHFRWGDPSRGDVHHVSTETLHAHGN